MPFTFSHPAIVVHLSKGRFGLSLTGLIAGSIVPDFEFFFRMRVTENIGHHLFGFFVFDIPAAFAFCFMFHNVIRNDFINHLPAFYRKRFNVFLRFDWNSYAANNKLKLLFSLIIGIASHFLWDSFTHFDGKAVLFWPILSETINFFKWKIHVYSVLQLLSSVYGLWIMHRFIKAMPVLSPNVEQVKNVFQYWAVLLIGSSIILVLRLMILNQYQSFWDVFIAVIGSLVYALIITAIGFKQMKTAKLQAQRQ